MKKRFNLLVLVLMTILLFVGCGNQSTQTSSAFHSSNVETYSQEVSRVDTNSFEQHSLLEESSRVEDHIHDSTLIDVKSVLPKVINNDFSRAYAQALVEGWISPTEETYTIMTENEGIIEYEPRLVVDSNNQIHIIWTN